MHKSLGLLCSPFATQGRSYSEHGSNGGQRSRNASERAFMIGLSR